MTVYEAIEGLCQYGVEQHLIEGYDKVYCRNQLLELMNLTNFEACDVVTSNHFECLKVLIDDASQRDIIESNLPPYSDLFEARLMNVFMPKPSEVIKIFKEKMKRSPEDATAYFYDLSKKSHYIRLDRTSKNVIWQVDSKFGEIDITINRSKPEKDPRAIAAALNAPASKKYPKCLLCVENEGYSGHVNHPGRQNHRIVPLKLNGTDWSMQYSPYAYFNEHSILLSNTHENMKITHESFIRLMDFLDTMPHYFVGSNADLPLVGGSLLTHDHYQAGRYEFAMARACMLKTYKIDGVIVEFLNWPLSVLRIKDKSREKVTELANKIFDAWVGYSDEAYDILAHTDERHNTVTPIARNRAQLYELDLVLRNNRCSEMHPTGVFHPKPEVHAVKKENIGLIEVMGLAVLPARLVDEMDGMVACLMNDQPFTGELEKFEHLRCEMIKGSDEAATLEHVKRVIGLTFVRGLEDAGVFKPNEKGIEGLEKFLNSIL